MSHSIRAWLAIGVLLAAATPAAAQYGPMDPNGPGPYGPGPGPGPYGGGNGGSFTQSLGGGPVADVWVRYNYADQTVGYKGDYATVGGIVPWESNSAKSQWFTQVQGNYSENSKFFGNIGLGRRFYMSDVGRMFGVSGWYDYDDDAPSDTFAHAFHQIGVNFETAGPFLDFRCNGYIPVGPQNFSYGNTCDNLVFGFVGNQLIRPGIDSALRGLDWQVSGQPQRPIFEMLGIRGNIGMYNYRSDAIPDFTGVMGGVQIQPTERMMIRYQATYDDRYGDTHTVMASINFNSPRSPGRELMKMPVQRNDHILRYNQEPFVYTNPATGLPYVVRHVDNTAAGPGTGTYEDPYAAVTQINGAGSTPFDLIFVEDSGIDYVLTSQVVLQNNQRLLGEGVPHSVNTIEAGFITVDCGSVGRPTLTGGFGITLADNNEVSNFNIISPGPSGIQNGPAITNSFNINQVAITGATGDAISIADGRGTGTIESVNISGSGGAGIFLETTGPLNATLQGNTINNSTGPAVFFTSASGANTVNLNILSNQFADNGAAIDLEQSGTAGGRFNLNIADNNFTNSDHNAPGGSSVSLLQSTAAGTLDYLSTMVVNQNRFTPSGLLVDSQDDTTELFVSINGGFSQTSITGNTFSAKFGRRDPAMFIESLNDSRLQLALTNNNFVRPPVDGTAQAQFSDGTILVRSSGTSQLFATALNNTNPETIASFGAAGVAGYMDFLSVGNSQMVAVVQDNLTTITTASGTNDFRFTALGTSRMALDLDGNTGPGGFGVNGGGASFQFAQGVNTGAVTTAGIVTNPPVAPGPPVTNYVNPAGILSGVWLTVP